MPRGVYDHWKIRGKKLSPATIAGLKKYWCTPHPERSKKISEALKGRKFSLETRRKLSEALSGPNHPNYGKHLPKKTRQKISKALMGHPVSKETRKKISRNIDREKLRKAMTGRHLSEETKRKVSLHNGMRKTEARHKLSQTRKRLFREGKLQTWNKGKHTGQTPWNKGLTKEDDKRLQSVATKASERQREWVKKGIFKLHGICTPNANYSQTHDVWNKGLTKDSDKKMRKLSEKTAKAIKAMWDDPNSVYHTENYRIKQLKAVVKGVIRRPTSYEQKIIDLCEKHNLPFKYCGDGAIIINYVCPDFIETNGRKLLIETYCNFWHPKNYEEVRSKRFATCGYKTLFLDDEDLCSSNWEQICLNKILNFVGRA